MVRVMLTIAVAALLVSSAVSQNGTMKLFKVKANADTVIAKKDLMKLKKKIRALKSELRMLKKELNKASNTAMLERIEEKTRIEAVEHVKRVYYVICVGDTSRVIKEYSFFNYSMWDGSRASLDGTCRVIEQKLNEDGVKEVRKAFKKGLIKQFGIWPDNMKRIHKWLNDPKNGFISLEVQ